jgi:hypothetical protein
MKQTAVEWLAKQYEKWSHEGHFIPKHLLELAKEMEKEQIIDAKDCWFEDERDGEQYYNETYKKK